MKFETLNSGKSRFWKRFSLGISLFVIALFGIFTFYASFAKYKVTTHAKLANETINYSSADFTLVAIKVQQVDEQGQPKEDDYQRQEKAPTGKGYSLNLQESYCTAGSDNTPVWGKDAELGAVNVEFKDGKLTFSGITDTNTRCYLWFDAKASASGTGEGTLADLKLEVSKTGCPEIDENTGLPKNKLTNETSTNGYLCEGKDDDGKTYYFRGGKNSVNNWVQMGSSYWRIIRINGDGTIRLIYNGTNKTQNDGIAKTSVAYNTTYNDNKYVGFMYGSASNNYKSATTNTTKSNILTQLDTLYGTIIPTEYKSLVDENAGFCNDRTPYAATSGGSPETGSHGFGSATTYYGAYIRVRTDQKPTFKCPKVDLGGGDSVDNLFTTTKSEKGNKALTNPIGLITADEVMYAGAIYGTSNTNYWLHNDSYYWTMSPSYYYYGGSSYQGANVFRVNNDGYLNDGYVGGTAFGVRPVINLKASTKFTTGGNGTSGDAGSSTNPFVVKLN